MIEGIILKGIGGFYYVEAEGIIYECKARGKFRKDKIIPLVGDRVTIRVSAPSKQGLIEKIHARDIELIRPPVANINQTIIIFSLQSPPLNITLLDGFLAVAESHELDIVLCFNKVDLEDNKDKNELKDMYKRAGYQVIETSTISGVGVDALRKVLKDRVSVFAGPSGVGKSSLLNAVQSDLSLKTGDISQKNKRGRHTTRHVELLRLKSEGWVVDTPGFSSLSFDEFEEEKLQYFFREFIPFLPYCKFTGCRHWNEPDCAVKKGVLEGKINKSRYENYIYFLQEINKKRRNR